MKAKSLSLEFVFVLGFVLALTFALPPALAAEQEASPIPMGTVITPRNWRQYKAYMPGGMQALFAGQLFWKLPADFKMVVGPTHNYPVGKEYQENTEKYGNTTKIVNLPDGRHTVKGYV
ncbi:MAG: hypothetical protein ACREP6_00475, partial [Candidatus Binataceae bacterium]